MGSDTVEYRAKSSWDHPSNARAALICRTDLNFEFHELIDFLLTCGVK